MNEQEIKDLIFETYAQYLSQNPRLLKEDEEKKTVFSEGEVLPDSTDQILAKYPQLKHCLERLQTEDFMEFVSGIDWVSPKPTVFRINLKNGTNFTLKWMGKDFEATISGKKYYLGQLVDYQKALSRLTDLYQEGPLGEEPGQSAEGPEPGGDVPGGGGGGNFPGEESGGGQPGEQSGGEQQQPEGEAGQEEPAENVKDAEINFEADASV